MRYDCKWPNWDGDEGRKSTLTGHRSRLKAAVGDLGTVDIAAQVFKFSYVQIDVHVCAL